MLRIAKTIFYVKYYFPKISLKEMEKKIAHTHFPT